MDDIIISELSGPFGKLGRLHLNRPKALNACTTHICKSIHQQLQKWQQDDHLKAVLITGEGDKAFCAGGDIRSLYANKDTPEVAAEFFDIEYANNLTIAHFQKPYIAWLDGITMGGGIGLSVHGSHRIATENTLVAMPETAIGLFPDVGGGYFLPRLAGCIGWYLGLTGSRLNPRETLSSGIATHLIESKNLEAIIETLLATDQSTPAHEAVDNCLAHFTMPEATLDRFTDHLKQQADAIKQCFGQKHFSDIIQSLKAMQSTWSDTVLKQLSHCSPTSLLLTFEQLQRGSQLTLEEDLVMEFQMTQEVLRGHDFFEGVRAMLIDKDKQPKWQPATLEEVSKEAIDAYFANAKST